MGHIWLLPYSSVSSEPRASWKYIPANIYMPWLIHVDVGQITIQYYKVIILQLKVNTFKKLLTVPSLCCNVQSLSLVWLCNTMDCSLPSPLSIGFSRQEYCSRFPFPPLWGHSHPRIKSTFPLSSALLADSLPPGQLGKTFAEKFYMHTYIERVGNDWAHTNTHIHIYIYLCYTFTMLIKNCLWEPFVCCSWSVFITVFAQIIQNELRLYFLSTECLPFSYFMYM